MHVDLLLKKYLTFGLVAGALMIAPTALRAQGAQDGQIQADAGKALDKKQFKAVTVTVHDGVIRLGGTVATYADREDADRRAHRVKGGSSVENRIGVAGPAIDDATLQKKLAEKLEYDRVGYGTTTFNSFTIRVQNGVVTLGGVAYAPEDKGSALAVVENYPGVKDVVDNIEVAPLSPMDDHIRIAEARAIYGFTALNKYAMDPGKPIRITVINGNVTLTGVVDSESDKNMANIRANSVPGVFKVTNLLQVAGKGSGSK